jgi:predicted nucleic acid-binding protein
MNAMVFDSGAIIAFERRDRRAIALVKNAEREETRIIIPANVLAQVWRNGQRQSQLSALVQMRSVSVAPVDEIDARHAGRLLGISRTTDVVDASVIVVARRHHARVITSDVADLRHLDPTIPLTAI